MTIWNNASFGSIRRRKEELNKDINGLEMKKEGERTNEAEVNLLREKRKELNEILEEEIMWRQKANINVIKERD